MLEGVVAVLLTAGAVSAGAAGARHIARGLRHPDDSAAALSIVRGIRGGVVGVALIALAAGLALARPWLLVFGVVFLAEELYETGVVALVLRRDDRAAPSGRERPATRGAVSL